MCSNNCINCTCDTCEDTPTEDEVNAINEYMDDIFDMESDEDW